MAKMPTIAQALAGVPISPSNRTINTFNNMPTEASSVQIKTSLLNVKTGSRSVGQTIRTRRAAPYERTNQPERNASPSKTSNQGSVRDIYSMDLGTMGIPREVARNDQNQNFLWTSANPLGPGDYQPDTQTTMPRSPAASFGKVSVPGSYKSHTA